MIPPRFPQLAKFEPPVWRPRTLRFGIPSVNQEQYESLDAQLDYPIDSSKLQPRVYFHILFPREPWNLAVRYRIVNTLGGSGIFPQTNFYGRQAAAELQIVRLPGKRNGGVMVQSIPMVAKVWGLRILLVVSLVSLCSIANSGLPGLALIVTWTPNGLFVVAYLRGVLPLPQFLERVHPIEPVIYRRLGVGLAKRIVETGMWPLMCGNDLPPQFRTRKELLDFTEQAARGAETCHAATFALASLVLLIYLIIGGRLDSRI